MNKTKGCLIANFATVPDFVTLDDWMPREIDKQAVHCLIDRALPRLDATQAEAVKAWQSRQ
ncbi:hypothetical protein [Klebsiella pneumoniae]|uniref:hypothetical protein n=1 Tax=Klebsiella pneumoniae TaxID=573 RepID=UPI0039B65C61